MIQIFFWLYHNASMKEWYNTSLPLKWAKIFISHFQKKVYNLDSVWESLKRFHSSRWEEFNIFFKFSRIFRETKPVADSLQSTHKAALKNLFDLFQSNNFGLGWYAWQRIILTDCSNKIWSFIFLPYFNKPIPHKVSNVYWNWIFNVQLKF